MNINTKSTTEKKSLITKLKSIGKNVLNETTDFLKSSEKYSIVVVGTLIGLITMVTSYNITDPSSSLETLKSILMSGSIMKEQMSSGIILIFTSAIARLITMANRDDQSYSKEEKKKANIVEYTANIAIAALMGIMIKNSIDPNIVITHISDGAQFEKIQEFLTVNPDMKEQVIQMLDNAGASHPEIKGVFDKISSINEAKEVASTFVEQNTPKF